MFQHSRFYDWRKCLPRQESAGRLTATLTLSQSKDASSIRGLARQLSFVTMQTHMLHTLVRACVSASARARSEITHAHSRTANEHTPSSWVSWVSGSAVILTTWQPLCRPHACKLRMKSVRQRRRRKKTAGSRRCSRTFLFPSRFSLFFSLYFFRSAKEFDRFKNLMGTLFFYFILTVASCVKHGNRKQDWSCAFYFEKNKDTRDLW